MTGGRARGADPEEVARALGRRHADAAGPAEVQTRETHISWVFLVGDRAYKLKKPVVLDFVDYGTAERRREMCLAEVRLNARLAPNVYLGVRSVRAQAGSLVVDDADAPGAVDFVVEMRRYDEDQSLAAAVARGDVAAGDLSHLGGLLAAFHRDCPPRVGAGGRGRVLALVERNLGELVAVPAAAGALDRLRAVGRFLQAFAGARSDLLDQRAAAGHVREVHGDLRAEHVILRPALCVVDCVEFDAGLRTLDVADDLAFLAMDLTALGAGDAVPRVTEAYRAAGGDYGDERLLWFYGVHRALVRAKVALVRAGQDPHPEAARRRAARGATLLALAERLSWRARGSLVLVVCGAPASGKSRLAGALAGGYDLPVVSSDVVRKGLAGLDPQERAPEGTYTPEFTERTYEELAAAAVRALGAAPAVVVDATFGRRRDREILRRRVGDAAEVVFAECLVSAAVLAERARRREQDPERVSDATAAIAQRLRDSWEPFDDVPPDAHLAVRADRPVDAVVGDVLALLDERVSA
jgi:aminoglycoside phosphotransferase family enzyme/predicted kinase